MILDVPLAVADRGALDRILGSHLADPVAPKGQPRSPPPHGVDTQRCAEIYYAVTSDGRIDVGRVDAGPSAEDVVCPPDR